MTKTFKLNDTLFFINGEYYLVDKEAKIEEGDWGIGYAVGFKNRKTGEISGNGYNLFQNDDTSVRKLESICDRSYKVISSTNKSLKDIYHFSIEGAAGGKQYSEDDLRKAFEAGRKLTVEGFEEEDFKDLDKFIQSLQPQIQSIEVEYEVKTVTKGTDELDFYEEDIQEPKLNSKGELLITVNY